MPSLHSDWGPSGLGRIIACAASYGRSIGKPDTQSAAAAEGELAHTILEKQLKGESIADFKDLPDDMLPAVDVCVEEINRLRADWPGADEGIESKIDLRWFGLEQVWGTSDYYRVNWLDRLIVLDYKHGSGIMVEPDCAQLFGYAAGVISGLLSKGEKFDGPVDLMIVQPRGRVHEPIKTATVSVADIFNWVSDVLEPAMQAALVIDAPATPGEDQCRWCKAKGECPEFQDAAVNLMDLEFADLVQTKQEITPVLPTDPAVLASVYEKLPILKQWIKQIEGAVFGRMERHEEVPGYHLARGRGSRRWHDEAEAAEKLIRLGLEVADIYPPSKLISPSQAEKLYGKKKDLADLIEYIPGGPCITKRSEGKDPYDPLLEDFGDLVKPQTDKTETVS